MSPHPWFWTSDNLASLDVDQLLVQTLPTLSAAAQIHVFSSCTNFPEHYLWAFHLQTTELDPTLCQNLEYRRLVKIKNSFKSASNSGMFVDLLSNLCVFLEEIGPVFELFAPPS